MDNASEQIQKLAGEWQQYISPMLRAYRQEIMKPPVQGSWRLQERFGKRLQGLFVVKDPNFPGEILFRRGSEFVDRLFPYILPPEALEILMHGAKVLSRKTEALERAERFREATVEMRRTLKDAACFCPVDRHDAGRFAAASTGLDNLASNLEEYAIILGKMGHREEACALFRHVRTIRDHAINCGDLGGEIAFAADLSLYDRVCEDIFAADAEMEKGQRIAEALCAERRDIWNAARRNREYVRMTVLEEYRALLDHKLAEEIEEVLRIPYRGSAEALEPYLTGEYFAKLNPAVSP